MTLGQTPGGRDSGTEGVLSAGNIEIEYWIGTRDVLVRKVGGLFEISGQDQAGKLNTVRSEVALEPSGHGEPVNIQRP